MKGDSSCHTFTNKGRTNYDQVIWSSRIGKCEHRTTIKRNVCRINNLNVCPQILGEDATSICPIGRYTPIKKIG